MILVIVILITVMIAPAIVVDSYHLNIRLARFHHYHHHHHQQQQQQCHAASMNTRKGISNIILQSSSSSEEIVTNVNNNTFLSSSTIQEYGTDLLLEITECSQIWLNTIIESIFTPPSTTIQSLVEEIMQLSDDIDQLSNDNVSLRRTVLTNRRYELFIQLMKRNYTSYIATASFLSPTRILRRDLPNVQDVPYDTNDRSMMINNANNNNANNNNDDDEVIPDCTLDSMKYQDNILDIILLSIFRKLVTKHSNGITSGKEGIIGLLEQGRLYMLQTLQENPKKISDEKQHMMVYNTLKDLMTPILPPFYRIFMSGIIPIPRNDDNNDDDNKKKTIQLGPWFYAPYLTTVVTPLFFQFLVGPSIMNRRQDGQYGGLLVEKCKFLQESNCKTLCMNQCKIPAENFFHTELGLDLTVSPNFQTQECQWNFGQTPIRPITDDPTIPTGCLNGCSSRTFLKANT